MYGATTLAKLVKQVFDLFGKVLVLPLHLQQHHCQLLLLSFAVVDLTLQKPHLLDHRNHSLYHYSRAIDMTTNHWLHIHHHHHHHHRIEANRIKLLVDLLPGGSKTEHLGVVVSELGFAIVNCGCSCSNVNCDQTFSIVNCDQSWDSQL